VGCRHRNLVPLLLTEEEADILGRKLRKANSGRGDGCSAACSFVNLVPVAGKPCEGGFGARGPVGPRPELRQLPRPRGLGSPQEYSWWCAPRIGWRRRTGAGSQRNPCHNDSHHK